MNEAPTQSTTQSTQSTTQSTIDERVQHIQGEIESAIKQMMINIPEISQKEIAASQGLNLNTVKYYIRRMQKKGMIEREGTNRKGKWIVK